MLYADVFTIRLPVPSLESSIHRYLTAVKPLLKPDEFENTKKLAEDFLKNGIGEKLQKLLVEKSKTTDNWVLKSLTKCSLITTYVVILFRLLNGGWIKSTWSRDTVLL